MDRSVLAFVAIGLLLFGCGQQTPAAGERHPLPDRNASQPPWGNTSQTSNVSGQTLNISLGTPEQVFSLGQFGLKGIPDMHSPVLRQPDGSYHVFMTGRLDDAAYLSNVLFSTRDFLEYVPVVGNSTHASSVFDPSCTDLNESCLGGYDAGYAGADFVYPASDGKDLLMLYHGATANRKDAGQLSSISVVGLARSTDGGISWQREGAVVSGPDPVPPAGAQGVFGTVEPGAIISGGYVYAFYSYFPSPGSPDEGGPQIQVARSPLASDASAGSWEKYYNGSFSQPGLGGRGSQVVPSASGCTRPAQPWPAYSSYAGKYLLFFICQEGWFFSTSADLVNWTEPERFYQAPAPIFSNGQETDENYVLVTPGEPGGTIGQSGYVLYAETPAWGSVAHELWVRPFNFTGG